MKASAGIDLNKNEKILCVASPSQLRNLPVYLLILLIVSIVAGLTFSIMKSLGATNYWYIVSFFLANLIVVLAVLRLLNNKSVLITNQRLLYKSGFVAKLIEIQYFDLEKIACYRTVMNRVFTSTSGTLIFRVTHAESRIFSIPTVVNVELVKRLIKHYKNQSIDLPPQNSFVPV